MMGKSGLLEPHRQAWLGKKCLEHARWTFRTSHKYGVCLSEEKAALRMPVGRSGLPDNHGIIFSEKKPCGGSLDVQGFRRIGWRFSLEKNKGYPTKEHLNILKSLGPTKYHRKSFKPVLDAR